MSVRTPSLAKALSIDFHLTGTIQVEPAYPLNGSNWMDYVTVTNAIGGSSTRYNQPDTACAGIEAGYSACIHGGEIRKLALSGVSSCDDLSARDALGAFEWVCDDSSGTATFYSIGLKDGRGLSDLILSDGSAFKSNAVAITQTSTGDALASTDESVWWTNPIEPLPDNSATSVIALDNTDDDGAGPDQAYAPGTIFTAAANQVSKGYNLNQDQLAIVVMPGATLSMPALGTTCNSVGKIASPIHVCGIGAGDVKFLWAEGTIDVSVNGEIFVLHDVTHSRFNLLTLSGPSDGFWLAGGDSSNLLTSIDMPLSNAGVGNNDGIWADSNPNKSNTFSQLSISNTGDSCVHLEANSTGNTFDHLKCANQTDEGITLFTGSDGNTFHDVTLSNLDVPIYRGAIFVESDFNVFTQILVTGTDNNSGNYPIYVQSGSNNIFNQVTAGLNADEIALAGNATGNTFNQLLSMGAASGALLDDTGANNTFSQVLASPINWSSGVGITLNTVTSDKFSGNLLVDKGCSVVGGTTPGLTDVTCAASDASDAVVATGINVEASIVGAVTSDDLANSSDTNGSNSTFPDDNPFDWFHFDNPWRTWGDGSAAPSRWISPEVGGITDFRVKSTDTVIFNRSGMNLGTQGAQENDSFVAGATCPSAVGGDIAATDQAGHTYLLNAVEILGDGIGNDNGLCESNESCLYTPNFGAYQGDGDLASCVFNDAGGTTTVTGVSIVGYTHNGV